MTFITSLAMERVQVKPIPAYEQDAPEAIVLDIERPVLTGNYLINNGHAQLVSPQGKTILFATPIQVGTQILVHLAFGTDDRRIAHTLTIHDFGRICRSFGTVLALAMLEAGD